MPFGLEVAHPGPQSWANTPTPRMPLKPAWDGPVSGLGQVEGTVGKVASSTWMGTRTAGSPPRYTSATCTGPQSEVLSANCTQVASAPEPAGTCCSATDPSACR